MKCSSCGRDVKKKERVDDACPACHTPFVFDPSVDRISDAQFLAMLNRVSSDGGVKWTTDHLFYELCRREGRPGWLASSWLSLGRMLGFGDGVATVSVDRARASELLDRWTRRRGTPPGLMKRAPGRREIKRSRAQEEELEAYSFDRAVITDRPETVDVLLANRFHFENNCAVISAFGYPEGAFDIVRRMLRNNPRLSVFVVHDCSATGCRLAERLSRDPEWFGGRAVRIVDVGLRPEHASAFNGLIWPATEAAAPGQDPWLHRYTLELAAIRPEQLVKRLYRAITETEAVDWSGDAADPGGTFTVFTADAGTSDGGADSFG